MPILRPCKNTAAFEALPDDKGLQLDLDRLEGTLVGLGWRTVVNAAVMLIVEQGIEVSIYRSGKLLLKTRDPDEAVRVFRTLHPHIEPLAPHEPQVQELERLARATVPPRPRN